MATRLWQRRNLHLISSPPVFLLAPSPTGPVVHPRRRSFSTHYYCTTVYDNNTIILSLLLLSVLLFRCARVIIIIIITYEPVFSIFDSNPSSPNTIAWRSIARRLRTSVATRADWVLQKGANLNFGRAHTGALGDWRYGDFFSSFLRKTRRPVCFRPEPIGWNCRATAGRFPPLPSISWPADFSRKRTFSRRLDKHKC